MIVLRSIVFNIMFYLVLFLFLILGSPLLLMPRRAAIRGLQVWGMMMNWMLRVICNIKVEIRGADKIPAGPLLVVGKHQSTWETFALFPLFDFPTMVLKQELLYIPILGWPWSYKFRLIGVERSAGSKAMRNLIARGKEAVALGRQVIILPEGTRQSVSNTARDYKPGAAALYTQLGVPCIAFGLNAGLFWPRRKFLRPPGTIVLEFGEVIAPGLSRKEFQIRMEDCIENITNRLMSENRT